MPVKVKICGLSRREDVEAVNVAGADYAGFVFYEKSRRYIGFDKAKNLLKYLDPRIISVAVCVSPDSEFIRQIVSLGFDRIQIHGETDFKMLDKFKIPTWQAVNLSNTTDLDLIVSDSRICGYVIDGAGFGSGRTFGWENDDFDDSSLGSKIRSLTGDKLFILAGGLTVENVRDGIRLFSPDVVDVSSGVESLGIKDRDKIIQFVNEVRRE